MKLRNYYALYETVYTLQHSSSAAHGCRIRTPTLLRKEREEYEQGLLATTSVYSIMPIQRIRFMKIRQQWLPYRGPLHTPTCKDLCEPRLERLQSQLPQQATSQNAQVTCTAGVQQPLPYVIVTVQRVRLLPICPLGRLGVSNGALFKE
jgi:hypothetical protein